MSIWGKIIGGAAGLAIGGPIGAILGTVAGHAFDKRATEKGWDDKEEQPTLNVAFTIGVIVLSAKMAKADGVVTKDEVVAFREAFHVPDSEARNVGRIWDQARRDTDGFEVYAQQIARLFHPGSPVLEELIGNLLHIAQADGVVHENEIAYITKVADIFGLERSDFERMLAVHGVRAPGDAYSILGVDPKASDDEVKAAYRKLIRVHHPDRLIADGMPEEFIRQANETMAAINAAYDDVEKARGMK